MPPGKRDGYKVYRVARAAPSARPERADVRRRDAGSDGPPLLLLLLPLRARGVRACASAREELLAAPGGARGRARARLLRRARRAAARARRTSIARPPGEAHAAAGRAGARSPLFDASQVPLAIALGAAPCRAPSCGSSAPSRPTALDSALALDLGAAPRPARDLGARSEALGIASGRLGSERGADARRLRGRRASTAPTASSVHVTGSSRNAAYSHVCTTTATKPAATNAR